MTNQEARESIREALRELIADGITPENAAERVLVNISQRKLASYVHPLVTKEARGIARVLGRKAEDRVFASDLRSEGGQITHDDQHRFATSDRTNSDHRQAQVLETFPLPDGNLVYWGRATKEQHKLRAAWQRQHAATCEVDARRHEWAIAFIEEHDASCLDDVEDWLDQVPVIS